MREKERFRNFNQATVIFLRNWSLSVSPSCANFLIPSCSLSKAIWSSRRAQRNSASLSIKVTLGIGCALAAIRTWWWWDNQSLGRCCCSYTPSLASSFWGTGSAEPLSSSRRAGEMVKKSTPARDLISLVWYEHESEYIKVAAEAHITERRAHDDGLVAMLLIIIENLLDRLHTRILIAFIILSSSFLVPVENLF